MPSPVQRPKDTRMNEVQSCVPITPAHTGGPDPCPGLSMTCFPSTELPWISLYCYFPLRDFKLSFLETYHSNQLHARFILGMINIYHLSWGGGFSWVEITHLRAKLPDLLIFLDWTWGGNFTLSTIIFSLEKITKFSDFKTGVKIKNPQHQNPGLSRINYHWVR